MLGRDLRRGVLGGIAFLTCCAGCAPSGPDSLLSLPTHDLLAERRAVAVRRPPAHRPPAPRPGAAEPSKAADRSEWAAEGCRPWRYVIIHHSATAAGSAELFDKAHRERGWDELGYHFVIDNGQGGPDGRVEVGSRWRKQKWGAHCGGTPDNEYNNYGIGICLVGDFSHSLPSSAQMASLRNLLTYLVQKYDIAPENVIGHCDAPNATTQCPGAALYGYLQQTVRPMLARQVASR